MSYASIFARRASNTFNVYQSPCCFQLALRAHLFIFPPLFGFGIFHKKCGNTSSYTYCVKTVTFVPVSCVRGTESGFVFARSNNNFGWCRHSPDPGLLMSATSPLLHPNKILKQLISHRLMECSTPQLTRSLRWLIVNTELVLIVLTCPIFLLTTARECAYYFINCDS